ncbi:MAG: hypothetical protein ACK5L6_06015 [Anaerorhabdus sp.]
MKLISCKRLLFVLSTAIISTTVYFENKDVLRLSSSFSLFNKN